MLDHQLLITVRKLLLDSDYLKRSQTVRFSAVGLAISCGRLGQIVVSALYDDEGLEVVKDKVLVKFIPGIGQGIVGGTADLFQEIIIRNDPFLVAGLVEGMSETANHTIKTQVAFIRSLTRS